jgi:hypothetical protein
VSPLLSTTTEPHGYYLREHSTIETLLSNKEKILTKFPPQSEQQIKTIFVGWDRWYMTVIPVLGKERQERI